ncbi:MAG: DUF1631 family protein [Luminiphilus sp.]|nr:DUF1631 family protein [Luminiphilus sp.]
MKPENPDNAATAQHSARIMALRQYTGKLLKPRLSLVAEAMADHLFNLSASAKLAPEHRTQAFEAFSGFKSRSKDFVATILSDIDRDFENLIADRPSPDNSEQTPAELDLLELKAFDNSLAIDSIVQAGSERYWGHLESLTLGLGTLLGANPRTIRLPFGLRGLATDYRRYIKQLELPDFIIAELDRAFTRNLLPEAGALYQELNAVLIANGNFPSGEIDAETQNKAPQPVGQVAPRPRALAPSDQSMSGTPRTLRAPANKRPLTQKLTPAISSPHNDALGLPERYDLSGTSATSEAELQASPLATLAKADGIAEYLPGRGKSESNPVVDEAMLARLRLPALQSEIPKNPLTEAQLNEKIHGLSLTIAAMRQTESGFSHTESLVNQLGLDNLDPELQPLKGSVQLIDNLYQTMFDTLPLTDNLGRSLGDLKLPLAELSLTDPAFFQDRQHPARLLVERLSELSALAPRNSTRVEQQINEALSTIRREFDGNLNIFEKALTKINKLAVSMLKQQQRNIQRQIAAEEGKEKREQTAQLVESDLSQLLPDGLMPASLLSLIDSFLRDELVLIQLRENNSPLYDTVLDRISQINNALQRTMETGLPLKKDAAKKLAETLPQGLGDNFLSIETQGNLQQLQQQLGGDQPITLTASSFPEPEVFAEPRFSERLTTLPRLESWVKRAHQLKLKSWISESAPDGSSQNLQLIWKNSNSTRFAFANEQGFKVKDINLIQLARELCNSLKPLTPSDELSIIERSVFQTLEKRQEDLSTPNSSPKSLAESRSMMSDAAQSHIRRAKRKGVTSCALAIHAEDAAGVEHIGNRLLKSEVPIECRGALSLSTHGLIVNTSNYEQLRKLLSDDSSSSPHAGIGIATINSNLSSAEALWIYLEDIAKQGLATAPNMGVVAAPLPQISNLASAVRDTYARLQNETPPPQFSVRPLYRRAIEHDAVVQTRYEVLSDGVAAGNNIERRQRYPLAPLTIATDCLKVNNTCRFAESVVAAGRALPVFQLRISTEAVLHPEFLDFLLHEVSESGIGTDRLWFELTDSVRLREDNDAAYFCRTLRSIGCQISIAEVNPKRGSTAILQKLKPHTLALDSALWPAAPGDEKLVALHQTISDLHHLVGEYVVIREDHDDAQAQQLGIDFLETFDPDELFPETLREKLPIIAR